MRINNKFIFSVLISLLGLFSLNANAQLIVNALNTDDGTGNPMPDCYNATSFSYNSSDRPITVGWTCASPASTQECYITDVTVYLTSAKYILVACTKDINDAPEIPPDTELFSDGFEGTSAAAMVAMIETAKSSSTSAPISTDRIIQSGPYKGMSAARLKAKLTNMVNPCDDGKLILDVLPPFHKALAQSDKDYRDLLNEACYGTAPRNNYTPSNRPDINPQGFKK